MKTQSEVNGERLWQRLMTLGKIGETERGGSRRLALTGLDKQGRELVCSWMRDAGLELTTDRIGNIFGRRPGVDNSLPPIVTGSHIDTQPSGGKFDGCYGVMAGLEVMQTLQDQQIQTRTPLELVIWTNEEGARFVPTMMGSGVFCGDIPLEHAYASQDALGISVKDELDRLGYVGAEQIGEHRVGAYLEAHIEQGPVLESEQKVIGIVTGVLGIRLINVTVTGREAHAGPTPMGIRHDALYAAAPAFTQIVDIGRGYGEHARATIGEIDVSPGSRNTIPGLVRFSVDLRHLVPEVLQEMVQKAREICARPQSDSGLTFHFEELQYVVPTKFDSEMIGAVRDAVLATPYTHMEIVSGAGHDACYLAKVAPTSMIFVPCKDGISHNEIESAQPEHLQAGANVLLGAMMALANH
ncbi:Zn-dependent hydrolase [Paraburkholderia guartelaensis]|uniref:Zn-dependent hydrolase n=1 Tax=Paraburkholderia guartelaensis TaxID=2546446 RepID=A0A4R5L5L3_9BURK|nr:Zn-dependent hydrolase [Paraburkholderia guartelaensis]TDG03552.1 Zn-dependent hydrolase [Paraburkholderia guartelaensis]